MHSDMKTLTQGPSSLTSTSSPSLSFSQAGQNVTFKPGTYKSAMSYENNQFSSYIQPTRHYNAPRESLLPATAAAGGQAPLTEPSSRSSQVSSAGPNQAVSKSWSPSSGNVCDLSMLSTSCCPRGVGGGCGVGVGGGGHRDHQSAPPHPLHEFMQEQTRVQRPVAVTVPVDTSTSAVLIAAATAAVNTLAQ
ncbi:hypothetical protein DFQ26_001888, partial [Actinomortierella ambigua]